MATAPLGASVSQAQANALMEEVLPQSRRSDEDRLRLTNRTPRPVEPTDGYLKILPMPSRAHHWERRSEMKKRPTVLVTGASGYIGSRLTALLSERGYGINALVRNPCRFPRWQGVRAFRYRLDAKPDTSAFAGVDALVHAAANVAGGSSLSEGGELDAAGELIEQAERFGIGTVIFLSSPTASPDAASRYGRVKWGIERRVLSAGGVVVRIGLVYGGSEDRGLFGVLSSAARRSPCLPALLPAPVVQPIHIDDLCCAILKIIQDKGGAASMYRLGQAAGVGFNSFLRNLAWRRHRRYPIALPVPLALAGWLAALGSALRFLPEYYSERLRGLQGPASMMDTDGSLRALGVVLRPLDEGLLDTGRRRRNLLDEGHALIRYVSGGKPRYSTLSRYVRAMEKTKRGRSLGLPPLYLKFPLALRCLDAQSPIREMPRSFRRKLAWRMNVAAILAETNPSTAGSFHFQTPLNLAAAAVLFIPLLVLEGLLRILAAVPRTIRRWLTAGRTGDGA